MGIIIFNIYKFSLSLSLSKYDIVCKNNTII